MSTLVALLSSGKGTWAQVNAIIKSHNWNNILLICNEFAFTTFESNKGKKVVIDEKQVQKSFQKLSKFLKENVKDFEVALNLSSGSGLEHMIVLSAVLKSGSGVRFVYHDGAEIKDFEILDEDYSNFGGGNEL